MAEDEVKLKKSEIFRAIVKFIFEIENKRGEILDHWISFVDDFSFAPQEFYAAIEKTLQEMKVPTMEMSHEEFREGGMLSDKRIYLRMFRERLAIYTCASPFGTGYFFSCRTVYVPALVRLWHILAAVLVFGNVERALLIPLGFSYSIVATVALAFALIAVMRNAAAPGATNLDAVLLRIPVVSTIYQDWFREESYYRVDTRLVYLKRIPELVREVAEEIMATKGAKLQAEYERAPILGDLYKRQRSRPDSKEKD